MTEEERKQNEEETEEEQPTEPQQPAAPTRPETVVEIKTPLDKPEFDWFIDTFMKKMGLTDRKQSAIMLSNMMYDMGLDPSSDLTDIQEAMKEMNSMLRNLPNTATALKVKDTLGGMFAAKTGRALLDKMPRVTGEDPTMDRMERIMDKYMPMILAMKTMGEMMRNETPTTGQQKTPSTSEIPEAVKAEIAELKNSVGAITDLLTKQRAQDEQKEFAAGVVESINAKIIPMIQALQTQVDTISRQPPPPAAPNRTEELTKISDQLKEAIDKMGEKAGQKNLTLADIDPILKIIDTVEQRLKKEPTGEFDWKTATISGITEMGKDAITAYKEVATANAAAKSLPGGGVQATAPANAEMQAIIRKQVQNYILARIQTGAGTMNIQEAAKELGLTPEEVAWAYQTLVAEGWINVKVPPGTQKTKPTGEQNEQGQKGTGTENETKQPFRET